MENNDVGHPSRTFTMETDKGSLLVTYREYVNFSMTGLSIEEVYELLRIGGHISKAYTLESFLDAMRRHNTKAVPSREEAPDMETGFGSFAFGDVPIRAKLDAKGETWFVAKDVCRVLGIENPRDTLAKVLDEDEKGVDTIYSPGGPQEMNTVSESGLYSLIFRSRKLEAKAFRKWVTAEVLPSIRKTGGYGLVQRQGITDADNQPES